MGEATIGRADIEAARERIAPWVRGTPILHLEDGAFGLPGRLSLKLELFQHTGSFKPRGAFNKMLTSAIPRAGVITASGGNFGQAVAYGARALGHRAEVFVPSTSPQVKVDRIRSFGAEVQIVEGYYDDALEASGRRAEETGALVVHAFDQPEVIAGQGTIGAELSEQLPDADTVLGPIGGGGLIGGIAAWYAGRTRVVGVEPETSRCMSAAIAAGGPVDVPVSGYAADSLGVRRAGPIAYALVSEHVEHVVLVPDDAIRLAQRRLWDSVRVFAEPGGAAALAPLLSGAYVPATDEHMVALVSGGNGDLAAISDVRAPDR